MYKIPQFINQGFPAVGQGPVYKEIARGIGIDIDEYETIKRVSTQVYFSFKSFYFFQNSSFIRASNI